MHFCGLNPQLRCPSVSGCVARPLLWRTRSRIAAACAPGVRTAPQGSASDSLPHAATPTVAPPDALCIRQVSNARSPPASRNVPVPSHLCCSRLPGEEYCNSYPCAAACHSSLQEILASHTTTAGAPAHTKNKHAHARDKQSFGHHASYPSSPMMSKSLPGAHKHTHFHIDTRCEHTFSATAPCSSSSPVAHVRAAATHTFRQRAFVIPNTSQCDSESIVESAIWVGTRLRACPPKGLQLYIRPTVNLAVPP